MKHTDESIREIFSKKLGEYESHVSPELWSNIASQLPQVAATTAASTTAVVAKTISAKLIWTAAIVAVSVASVMTYFVVSPEDAKPTITAKKTEQATANVVSETDAERNAEITPSKEASGEENKQNSIPSAKQVAQPAPPKTQETVNSGTIKSQIQHSYPIADIAPAPQESVIVTPPPATITPKSSEASHSDVTSSDAPLTAQSLTALFTTAAVNKQELRYFFMPQFSEGQSYLWDFGNGHTSTEVSPMHMFDEEGVMNIHLTVVGKDGRKKEYTQKLSVFQPGNIEVPNVFTPNGDGQNDYLDVLEKSKNADIQKIVVFSSTDKVFESDGDRLWDGTDIHGNPLPAGEYKYFVVGVDKEGNKLEKKGFVTLRRQ